jgi:hypothetical protein
MRFVLASCVLILSVPGWTQKKKEDTRLTGRTTMHVLSIATPQGPGSPVEVKVEGTGRTTGHVIDIWITNLSDDTLRVALGPYLVPATGAYQGYIVPSSGTATLLPRATESLPLTGYCTDIHRKPVPEGRTATDPGEWITPDLVAAPSPGEHMAADDGYKPANLETLDMVLTYPGSDIPFNYTIDINRHPRASAGFLFSVVDRIADTYDSLRESGSISTPFSAVPAKERESVIQQTTWLAGSILTGSPYTYDDFAESMEAQFTAATGKTVEEAPEDEQEQFQRGAEAFWSAFTLVGEEAKVLRRQEVSPGS